MTLSKPLPSNMLEKNEHLVHLENISAQLIANCLLHILPISSSDQKESVESHDKAILAERLIDNIENRGSNKKAKVEFEWSWSLVIREFKDEKENSRHSWILIVEKLIESGQMPEGIFFQIVDFMTQIVQEINLDNAVATSKNRKTLNSIKNINSFTFQLIYFRLYYVIVKTSNVQESLLSHFNKSDINLLLTKTAEFFLKNLEKSGRFIEILNDIIDLNYQLDTGFFKVRPL